MIKKSLSLFVIAAILLSLFPGAAFAAGGTINADGTYDIGSYGNNSVINIEDGRVVTLKNSGDLTLTNVQINCGYGTVLTIDGIKIDNSANAGVCALSFTQYHNKLILMGDSFIKSGNNMPGIKEDSSSELEISGEGSIEVYGGTNAAGIGGTYQSAEMVTTISGGTVKATGGSHGAGIGGGDNNQDLMVIINGGSVSAQGGDGGAGIGGGYNCAGGVVIRINGGDVNAVGGAGGAGIGGGYNSRGGESTIQGDCTVRAIGGSNAAGIGGGQGKPGGTLGVLGGLVLAEGNGGCDIGCGAGGTSDEYDLFNISENAAVLLRNGICTEPTTLYHELKVQDPVTNHTAFGFNLPDSWTKAYAYLKVYYDLTYDANGGEGTLQKNLRQHEGTSTAVADGEGLTKEEDVFCKWNTQPNGLGLDYKPGDSYSFSENITLYAVYTAPVHVSSVTLDKENADVIDGDTLKLNAAVLPANTTYHDITWTSSNKDAAAVDGEGNVTAIYPGTATITASADGISDTCDITVKPKHVTSVTLSSHSETLEEGDTVTLTAAVLPDNSTYPKATWSSDNESVVAVNQSGFITAAGAGTATITAAADGVSDSCEINVDAKRYTVLFDMQYTGAENPTVKVDKNTVVTAPQQPERSGYAFIGWFREQSCINEWDFSGAVTDNITLYALWKKDGTQFSGCGTQTNPYRITNGAELANLSALVNAGNADYRDKFYIQTQDIDLSAYANWTPIGIQTYRQFSGTYDGNGKSITGLSIDSQNTYINGLFGNVSGNLKNIKLENGKINVNCSGSAIAGGIAAYLFIDGSVQNCSNSADINVSTISTRATAGGIVGTSVSSFLVSGCVNSGDVFGMSRDYEAYVGGIVGSINDSTQIMNCANYGIIRSRGAFSMFASSGGIAGIAYQNSSSSIYTCYNTGEVSGSDASGGIIGKAYGTSIANCFNAGHIHSGSTKGGIVGYGADTFLSLRYCYNIGSIYPTDLYGGIVGSLSQDYSVQDCYYVDSCTAGIGRGIGTTYKRALEQMQQRATYTNFDFDTVWTLDKAAETGYSFPQLRDNTFCAVPHSLNLTTKDEAGTVSGPGTYKFLDRVTVTATPKENYRFISWSITGGYLEQYSGGPTASFLMPNSDVTMEAEFESDNVEDFDIIITDENAVIKNYKGTESEVRVPSLYQGHRVTAIDDRAFISNTVITSVEIPDTITSIGEGAFIGCTKLKSIRIGNNVKRIEDKTFVDCQSLNSITLPDSVVSIGDTAFMDCKTLKSVTIGAGVKSIETYPFNRCYALTEIDVSESNANYCSADGVLYNKDKTEIVSYPPGRLGSYSILQGVTSIAPTAFSNCELLMGISIPDSVRSIGQYAFNNTRIVSVTIPDNVENIEDSAFDMCSSLQNVTFGENIKSIGECAFYGCKITRLDFPETLTAIKSKAFACCGQLTNVYFWGSRPGELADNAFEKCSSCQIYYHVSNADSWVTAKKTAFCVLTLEQGEELGKVTQNAILDIFRLVKPADPKREDYAFAGWYTDTKCKVPYDFDNNVTGDITLYAKWTPLKFNITYALDGGSLSTSNPSYYRTDGGAITLRNPVRTGYTFAGWSGTGISGVLGTVTITSGSTGDRNYIANWTPNTYAITFNSKEGSYVPPVTVQYGSLISEPAPPSKPGYSFVGWYMESSCVSRWNFATETATEDDTLYAKWDPQKFSISYDLGGGSPNAPNPEYYMTDGGAITLHNPAKTGHTFSGWSGTGISGVLTTVTIPSGSIGDRHYAANWSPNTYTITLNSKEGSNVAAVNAQYGSLIPEPAPPSKPGYSFAGWYKESSCINRWNFQTDIITGSDTLYARWQPFSCLLDYVELSAGTLMKPFAKSTASYNITLGEYEESITLTPVKEYDGALMKINNTVRNSITLNIAGGKSVTVKVSVTFNKKTKNYTFKITRAKSSNNALSSLYATAGSFDKPFDPNIQNYTLKLDENTKSVTIKAASASGAGVSPASKTLTLNNGAAKTFNVTVKAQTGAKRTYTITVIRASASNADLKMLKAPGLSPGFSAGTTNYMVALPANKGSFGVSAKAAGYKAAVYIDGVKKSSKKVIVPNGQSITVCVTVVAQAGNTKDYYITVTRPLA